MTGATAPDPASAAERLDEVARILALGILRLRARRQGRNPSQINGLREFPLDFPGGQSVSGGKPGETGEGP